MKTLKKSSITFLLLVFSLGLSAQIVKEPEGTGITRDTLCQAAFSFLPDSLTSFPFLYHFKDLSSGNLNTWYWDFGDGSFSSEQSPSHQYAEAGNYQVCLAVADQNDTAACSDQVCKNIVTLQYFSLGGLVYAGEYPLNNPVNYGDTGVASLYRIVNEQIVFVEDHYFLEYGYYWFGYLFPGDYMVKVGLTQGSPHYNNYFTTYYGNDILWTVADMLSITTSSLFEAEIHMKAVQEINAGAGIIKGSVKFEQGDAFSMPPISQTTVILSDINHTPLLFTKPNPAGYFEFTGIPFNTYFLTADATGKPASTVTFTLTESAPVVDGINLTVFGSNVNFIPEAYEKGFLLTSIFPNPVKDVLHLRIFSGTSAPVSIHVTDLAGKSYYRDVETLKTGFNQVPVPTASLPSGIYFLSMQLQGHYSPVTVKFIK